ncbi:MAG: fructosamine kinase family protein [Flavobacteriales bacterium]|nr:fructosamine kinase family protein [Flavobacteriales bacterium]
MPLTGSLIERLCEHLSRHCGTSIDIEQAVGTGGGSINDAYQLHTNEGRFFVKVNAADRFPSLFEAEADGLKRLQQAGSLRVPVTIALGEDHDDAYLLLEWIDGGTRTTAFWDAFGRGLARLHGHTWERFGLERDNYIGSLKQVNHPESDWTTFLIKQRLEPQLKMARDRRRLDAGTSFRFERLFARLDNLFPAEPPALLHGDLWSGNFLCDPLSAPVLIDPAVYYGHREMDLAMTRLFGGFDPLFLTAYQAERPLEQGWEERADLCALYPLLVHVNLFGGGYLQQVEMVLRRFT